MIRRELWVILLLEPCLCVKKDMKWLFGWCKCGLQSLERHLWVVLSVEMPFSVIEKTWKKDIAGMTAISSHREGICEWNHRWKYCFPVIGRSCMSDIVDRYDYHVQSLGENLWLVCWWVCYFQSSMGLVWEILLVWLPFPLIEKAM